MLTTKLQSSKHSLLSRRNFGKNPLHYENGWSKYKTGPACHYEPILWFAHRDDSTFHVIREPYKSEERLRHAITKNGKRWTPNPAGRQAGDVWRFPTLAGRRFANERTKHPTQKPLALSRRLIEHFSNENEMVVIPFAGSGSECAAAMECNRRFVASEINPEYVEITRNRLADLRHLRSSAAASTRS